MNRRMVFNMAGKVVTATGLLLILPTLVALIYKEFKVFESFLIVAVAAILIGFAVIKITKPRTNVIYAKEGFLIVALTWLSMSLVGAVPFVLCGEIPNYADAFFEIVSGFTTTGASVLPDVEALSHAALFWRSFSHWIGGMGILVFMLIFIPNMSDRSIHILRAEMPGPVVGKLVPKATDTARILYIIYLIMTATEIVLLFAGGMPFFDSMVHSFGTAGTGGFGIRGDSIMSYSPYCQWIIAIFMFLFGINFNLYYLLLIRRFKSVFRSGELWAYVGISVGAVALICADIYSSCQNLGEALRLSAFQVSSIVTTTGYSTADFNLWPTFSKTILLLLMIVGACAGSTAGGMKVSRVVIIVKTIKMQIKALLHPRSVNSVKFEGKTVGDETLKSVNSYLGIYCLCLAGFFFVLSFDSFGDIETNISATIACFNNIGPGFGGVGPMANYDGYNYFSKIILSFAMLFGRLEIFPMIIFFSPSTWTKQ
ncbi:MAG: TrkH family potassium uptake protein [Ruminococcaceae bacterium]|nr:TrkH family potassium uptake protein [Oscillospiraceae bacterium]